MRGDEEDADQDGQSANEQVCRPMQVVHPDHIENTSKDKQDSADQSPFPGDEQNDNYYVCWNEVDQKADHRFRKWNTFTKRIQSEYADEERKKYSQYPGQPVEKFLVHIPPLSRTH